MRLTAKLVLGLSLGVTLLLVVYAVLRVQRETELFHADMSRDQLTLGRMVRELAERVQELAGEQAALQEVADLNARRENVEIRWVWLDEAELASSGPLTVGDLAARAARGQEWSGPWVPETGEQRHVSYVPLPMASRPAALELTESREQMRGYVRTTVVRTLVVISCILLIFTAGAGILGYYLVAAPLSKLIAKMKAIGAGDFTRDVVVKSKDELGTLAVELADTCGQLERARQRVAQETEQKMAALEQLRHADRLKTVGRLASGVAHELGTPLNVIQGRAGMIIKRSELNERTWEDARSIETQAKRITGIVQGLLNFCRQRSPKKTQVMLGQLIKQVVDFMQPLARKSNVELCCRAEELPTSVMADAGQLQQVFSNLILNAVQASRPGGVVEISLTANSRPPGAEDASGENWNSVTIRDYGGGIPAEHLPHIFEPFFTTKDVGEGTGLGLSIAYGIVREHGGEIAVETTTNGASFTVYLPC